MLYSHTNLNTLQEGSSCKLQVSVSICQHSLAVDRGVQPIGYPPKIDIKMSGQTLINEDIYVGLVCFNIRYQLPFTVTLSSLIVSGLLFKIRYSVSDNTLMRRKECFLTPINPHFQYMALNGWINLVITLTYLEAGMFN